MEKSTLTFPHNARTVFAAIKHLFEMKKARFTNIRNNISDLTDYISNEVHKLCQPGEIKMRQ